jgi:hypothetical protein
MFLRSAWSPCSGDKLLPAHIFKLSYNYLIIQRKNSVSVIEWLPAFISELIKWVRFKNIVLTLPGSMNLDVSLLTSYWMLWLIYIYIYSARKKEWNSAIYSNMDRPTGHYIKWNKLGTRRQILHPLIHLRKWKTFILQK